MDSSQTGSLFRKLEKVENLEDFLDRYSWETPTLAEYLQQELVKRGLRRTDVLNRAGIGQTFGWYVFSGRRGIGRDNVLKLCFAMGFDVAHTQRALQAAGANALYPKRRRDAIIIYCLHRGDTLQQANETLYAFGEECL